MSAQLEISPVASVFGDARLPERFWSKVTRSEADDCWRWKAYCSTGGYAIFQLAGKARRAHRVAYEALVGPIPERFTIDHVCRVRNCVNPAHLEVVTHVENIMRGQSPAILAYKAGLCMEGHEMGQRPTPTGGIRGHCRQCHNERNRRYRRARASAR